MKKIMIICMLASIQVFANYAFDSENTVKIDMHGGKNEKLTDTTKGFSEMKMDNFKGLQGISIKNTPKDKETKEKEFSK